MTGPPRLPVLALALTGLASLAAATLGTAQAHAAHEANTRSLTGDTVHSELQKRSEFGLSARERIALDIPDIRGAASVPKPKPDDVVSTGECEASYYDTGSITANGESFDTSGLTAANKELPFDTMVRVTNKANDQSVVVRINDRGPYIAGRCLDLTPVAMQKIAGNAGTADVKYEVLKKKA